MKQHGIRLLPDGSCIFRVWAPEKEKLQLHLYAPEDRLVDMKRVGDGFFETLIRDIGPGARYKYVIEGGEEYPDPASRWQPEGVHGCSAIPGDLSFIWEDAAWKGIPPENWVMYELHVGTFTPEGTFEAIIPRLKDLHDTGINVIELMPVAQFPGTRNWGYDGAYPFAVQHSYGGPEGLKKLVNACHKAGIAVVLDVVYNHLGPEGNYLGKFGPYFTAQYHTPWGDAINYDGAWGDVVKEFFVENLVYWLEDFHIDGLRLDAVHMIFDNSAQNFWLRMSEEKSNLETRTGHMRYLIAESDLNSPRVLQPVLTGGYNFDMQWLDDFHHALYVLLDPAGKSRYEDFGSVYQLAKAYKDGFVHSGEFVKFRKRRHGSSSAAIDGDRFIVFNQNHDQVGNRPLGERLCMLVNFERLQLAAAAIMLSPYIPMLFMGEEYCDQSPFFYFVSHSDKKLIEAVREGRRKEFAAFKGEGTPPDAQAEETFLRSRLDWSKRTKGTHHLMLQWHQALIRLRRKHPVLLSFSKSDIQVSVVNNHIVSLLRQTPDGRSHLFIVLNFSDKPHLVEVPGFCPVWSGLLDSGDSPWREGRAEGRRDPHPETVAGADNFEIGGLSVVVYEGLSA